MADNNSMRRVTTSDFGINKWSKEVELNESMSIIPKQPDEYSTAVNTLRGRD